MVSDSEALLQQRIALLDAWVSKQREIARLQAEAAGLLAERWVLFEEEVRVEPAHSQVIEKSMIAEYAAAGRLPHGAVVFAFTDARMLTQFPAVHAAFTQGRVTGSHVREILRES
ncbi:MAG: HNH endonuclease, partial [Microbacterium sp.]